MILKVDFALNLSNYTSCKCFLCLKWILKMFPQYCILSLTTIRCWSLPLKNQNCQNLNEILYVWTRTRKTDHILEMAGLLWLFSLEFYFKNYVDKYECSKLYQKSKRPYSQSCLVKLKTLMIHTSKEFIKSRLKNFSMGLIIFYVNLQE